MGFNQRFPREGVEFMRKTRALEMAVMQKRAGILRSLLSMQSVRGNPSLP
jgi:hypothetical protein